jgi:hypothetical protein
MMEEEDKTNNPFFILQMDEEEEVKDAEMEDKVDEMQVASPQRSPRRPAEKRIEREDASEGSMRRPSNRGKHEKEEMKKYQEGASEEEMTDAGGEIEEQPENEGTRKEKEEEEDKSSGEKVSTDDERGMEAWLTYKERVKKAEDDDLSYLGEDDGEGEKEKQQEAEGNDHPDVSEEEEWDDTDLEKEAQGTKEMQRMGKKESQEGEETIAR